ncbi:MAG: hypothetical protein EB023_03845 [Flavobacteriia bacterium]|nr:hypothetical protein [Flavobacteriia bacterium]
MYFYAMRNIGFLGAWLLALPFFSQAIDCPILPAPVTYTLTGRTPEFLTTQELSFEVGHLPQEMVSVIPQIAGLYLASPEKRLAFTPQAGLIQFHTLPFSTLAGRTLGFQHSFSPMFCEGFS